ncbi:MAG: HDOD domain-containing protein [Burkholderiales bacterium]|nr:HDOD domain-containing protein [Burkholderiales bacterium]
MNAVVAAALDAPHTDLFSPGTEQLIKEIGIPPCPAVLAEFMAEANRDEPDFRRLSHLVNRDVALAASVLKAINSPFYGLAKKARTVQDALALLGLRETSRLIAGLLLRRAFASSPSPAMYEFWDASSRIAMITAYLARELEVARLDEAHTFALFRDCGIPVLLARYPEYEQLLTMTRCENEHRRSALERSRYGFDHALVGATLAQSWHLPSEMWQAIRVHNDYDEPGFVTGPATPRGVQLIALGLLAEQLHRIHRGTYDGQLWVREEAFITELLGPMHGRLEPLGNDIARILEQA